MADHAAQSVSSHTARKLHLVKVRFRGVKQSRFLSEGSFDVFNAVGTVGDLDRRVVTRYIFTSLIPYFCPKF